MADKVKTSIVIDRRIWEEFKSKVGSERGLKMLSNAIEEAIEEEVSELLVIDALEKLLKPGVSIPLTISPIKPRVATDSGKVIREMRYSRH